MLEDVIHITIYICVFIFTNIRFLVYFYQIYVLKQLLSLRYLHEPHFFQYIYKKEVF